MPTLSDLIPPFLSLTREQRLAIIERVRKNRWVRDRTQAEDLDVPGSLEELAEEGEEDGEGEEEDDA